MRMRNWLVAIALAIASTAAAQGGTIGGSSGVTYPLKAANGTAAAPSVSFANSTGLGLYRLGADTLGFANAGVFTWKMTPVSFQGPQGTALLPAYSFSSDPNTGVFSGGADEVAVSAGGTSRLEINTIEVRGFVPLRAPDGTAAAPGHAFGSGNRDIGLYRLTDTLGIATTGIRSLSIAGGAVASIIGGAGSMTLLAGTGASRTLTLRSSNSSSAATTFAVGSGDTLKTTHIIAVGLTAAAGTPNSLCLNATTKEVEENAALTCTVSARRFKRDIAPLSLDEAKRIIMGLKPSTFVMRSGGRKSIGLIAEEVDLVDERLTFRNAKGQLNSVDYQALGPIMILLIQEQQRQLDALTGTRTNSAIAPLKKHINVNNALAFLGLMGAAGGVGAVAVRRRPSLRIDLRA